MKIPASNTARPDDLAGISVLVVDDDRGLREELCEYLQSHGMRADNTADIVGARHRLELKKFDLLLLDLWLGSENGFDLLREIRRTRAIPCIMMTAQDDITDKIVGLELGADDYMFKPVNLRELLARARSLLRRARGQVQPFEPVQASAQAPVASASGWRFDVRRRHLSAPDGETIPLTTAECELLTELVANEGRPQTRDDLYQRAFNRRWDPHDRSLDGVIMNLRRKLEPDPENPLVIKTVRGKGYVFTGFPAE